MAGGHRSQQSPGWAEVVAARRFFAPRAAGWEEHFPEDGPAFAAAVAALRPRPGATALDAACGTGRALPWLRRAVGPSGTVVGLDVTPEMLGEADRLGRRASGALVMGDVRGLPLPDGSVDAILGAGLLPHLSDPAQGLTELARVARGGARLALFHPIGRVALADRHGRTPDPEDVRAEHNIGPLLSRTGWRADLVDDSAERYLVIATRQRPDRSELLGEAPIGDEPHHRH